MEVGRPRFSVCSSTLLNPGRVAGTLNQGPYSKRGLGCAEFARLYTRLDLLGCARAFSVVHAALLGCMNE